MRFQIALMITADDILYCCIGQEARNLARFIYHVRVRFCCCAASESQRCHNIKTAATTGADSSESQEILASTKPEAEAGDDVLVRGEG